MLTLDQLRATLAECGCCPPPGCCPPVVECRSGFAVAKSRGFTDPDASISDDLPSRQTRYLRHIQRRAGVAPPDVIALYFPYIDGGPSYVQNSFTVDWSHSFIQEFSQGFDASVSGAYFAGGCGPDMSTAPVESYRCEVTGGWTEMYYAERGSAFALTNYLARQVIVTLSDAEGEETENHIAWETESAAWDAAHPDYAAEVAAHAVAHPAWVAALDAWNSSYNDWTDAWNAWHEGGEIGDAPVEPDPFTDPEPTLAEPRPTEPPEFYGPCIQKKTTVTTRWEEVGSTVVLTESTEEDPNPSTEVSYSDSGGGLGDIPYEEWERLYEEPVTFEDFLSLAEAWIATKADFEHASDSGSDACPPGNLCQASKKFYADPAAYWQSQIEIDFFQYRFKHNKCCAWAERRSEWDTIFYPQEWLDWKTATAALGSGDEPIPEPSRPVKNPRAWTWTGTPPRCDDSSSSESTPTDPYDYEPMWSPWSATIFVPAGNHEGIVVNRNYQQKCYEAPPEEFPDLFGTYDTSSES